MRYLMLSKTGSNEPDEKLFTEMAALRHFDGQRQHFLLGDFPALADLVLEMPARHELHGNVKSSEGFPGPQHPHDVGIAE